MSSINIIVTGGRNYDNYENVKQILGLFDVYKIYMGDAAGADMNAVKWASIENVRHKIFVADWKKHNKAAGPLRNALMLDTALKENGGISDGLILIAFPGGRGTANCVAQALKRAITVLEVKDDL